jgi:uracil-DNA glycosylase
MNDVRIHESWKRELTPEFSKPYFVALREFVRTAYTKGETYPTPRNMLRAFDECPFDQVKVVILGQDPYHGPNQANGLCFAVNEGTPLPPSLQNIFKEIESDLGHPVSHAGDLSRWARQGVLLLNATLTVSAGLAGSHQGQGWEEFTDAAIAGMRNRVSKRSRRAFSTTPKYGKRSLQYVKTRASPRIFKPIPTATRAAQSVLKTRRLCYTLTHTPYYDY